MKKFCLVIAVFLMFVVSCDNLYNDVAEEKKDMQKLIFVNADGVSVDLTKDPYGITEWEGFSKVDLNLQIQQVPFHDGSVYLDGLLSERELSVTLAMNDEKNLEKRYRLRRELIEILNPKLGEGTLIYTNDYTSKQIKVVPQTPLFENHNSNDTGTPKASLAWTACDPYWEDVEETEVEFDMLNPANINYTGDVPTEVKIELNTAYCKDIAIRNITDDKLIKINGAINRPVLINTHQGEKNVEINDIKFQWSNGGSWGNYAETNQNLYLYGSQLIVINQKGTFETFDVKMNSTCYSDDKKIFVGSFNDKFYYSYDGVNWQEGVYTPLSEPLNNINKIIWCEDKNLFVAGGRSTYSTRYLGQIFVSQDGINWTGVYCNQMGAVRDITYSPTLGFYAVGNFVSDFQNKVAMIKSSDGITWTEVIGQDYIESCVWNNTLGVLFVMHTGGTYDKLIKYTYDGINWNRKTVTGRYAKMTSIDSLGLILIAGINSFERIYITTFNGISWENIESLHVGNVSISKILYSNILNQIVIIGEKGLILLGDNVNNLQELSTLLAIPYLSSISVGDYFYAVGSNFTGLNVINKSDDGKFWESSGNQTATMNQINDIYYSERLELYIIAGSASQGSAIVRISENGSMWLVGYNALQGYCYRICESDDIILITVDDGILGSSDGRNWDYVSDKKLGCICWNEEEESFFATEISSGIIFENGTIIKSTDGVTWSETDFSASFIAYEPHLKKMIAQISGTICISNDGETWRNVNLEVDNYNVTDITYMEELKLVLMITGRSGSNTNSPAHVYISNDMIHWTKIQDINQSLVSCTYNGKQKKTIITSGKYGYQPSGDECVFVSKREVGENIIDRLDSDSNMNFNIIKGVNVIKMNYTEGSCFGKLYYRQKYLGV